MMHRRVCSVAEARKAGKDLPIDMRWNGLGATHKCLWSSWDPPDPELVGRNSSLKVCLPRTPCCRQREWACHHVPSHSCRPAQLRGPRCPWKRCVCDSGSMRAAVSRLHLQGAPASHLCRAAVCFTGDLEATNGNPFRSEPFAESGFSAYRHLGNARCFAFWVICPILVKSVGSGRLASREQHSPQAGTLPAVPRGTES